MLITLDRPGGVGKSTQLHILAEQLGLTIFDFTRRFDLFHNLTEVIGQDSWTGGQNLIAAVQAFHTMLPSKPFVFDRFGDCLWGCILMSRNHLTKTLICSGAIWF